MATPQSYWENKYLNKKFRKTNQPHAGKKFECVQVDVFDHGTQVRLRLKEEGNEENSAPVLLAFPLNAVQRDFDLI